MKLVKVSSQKLICQSNLFPSALGGFALAMGGIALLVWQFPRLTACWQDKVCYQTSMQFQSMAMLEAFMGTVMGIFMAMLGISLFIKSTSIQRVIFDLARNQLIVEQHRLFLRKLQQRQFSLSEVCDVNVDILKDTGADPDTYQVVIVLTNGTSIPLGMSYAGSESWHTATAETIREFLSLP
jgi:hypothetical protein